MTSALWWTAAAVLAAAAVASLPYWLPRLVVALRIRIFAWVNGDEGIPVPGRLVGVDAFRRVYADPAANGRSRGAALSDLFWYWLAPGPEVHQEHLEQGPRYDQVARTTRRILADARPRWESLVTSQVAEVLDGRPAGRTSLVRLRDLMMPVWAGFYFELVFGEPCPPHVRDLIVGNADDVVSALKCTRLRHMKRRDRLTRYLYARVRTGTVPWELPGLLTEREQTYYLQGTFFNTAVVQMSEAMAHLLLVIATNPAVQQRLRMAPDDTAYLDRVIDEALRTYPLFGVAHRITTRDIVLGDAAIPSGSVLLFNYAEYHHAGLPDGARFDPDRWLTEHHLNHIPFGETANRPCPARGVAQVAMRVAAREVLSRYALASSAAHTRSLPNRGPCLLTPLTDRRVPSRQDSSMAARLWLLRVGDRWEDVWRSLVQLVLGSYMVWDARRQRLCQRYFASQGGTAAQDGTARGAPA